MRQTHSAPPEFTYDVYLSYAASDASWVDRELRPRLKRAKLRTIDETSFAIGAPILRERERAVQHSRYTLLVISPAWLNGAWQAFDELLTSSFGIETRTWRAIPLIIAPCTLPPRLQMLVKVDLTGDETAGWRRLLRALAADPGQTTPSESFEPDAPAVDAPVLAPLSSPTPIERLRKVLVNQGTLRRIGLGALIAALLALIGLWADLVSIGQWWQSTATPAATIIIEPPVATPQPTAASFTYGVTVKDASTDQPIAQAKVLIEVTGKAPLDEYTDDNGYAPIVIPSALVDSPGRLTISADGYAVERQNIDLWPDRLPDEFRLTRR